MQETVQQLTDAQTIAEHTARILMSACSTPEFGDGGIPVAVAANVLGKEASWVQAGIISGWLPIGIATQGKEKVSSIKEMNTRKRTNYYISPKLFWEMTGYVWKGEINE